MRHPIVAGALVASLLPQYSPLAQPLSRDDSLQVLREAQHAQWDFERHRRFDLPSIYSNTGAPCDLIGRFCVRHGGIAFERIPLENLSESRESLLRALDTAAALLPGDDWIAGQRVRYLVDAGEGNAALRAARSCRGTAWWCEALEGLALHMTGDFAAAERVFDRALADMPEKIRCRWTDLSYLLEEGLRAQYLRLSCNARKGLERRIWLFADPLFITSGNERRTEHFARHAWAESERAAVNTFGMPWGPDLEEMIVRFGWAEKWTREPSAILQNGPPVVNGHEHEPNYHFFPDRDPPQLINTLDESVWRLGQRQPTEAYAPSYAQVFVRFLPQVARFRRGDSTLIVAAYRTSDDDFLAPHRFDGALAIVADDSTIPLIIRSGEAGLHLTMIGTTPAPIAMLSVEALARDSTIAARWRAVMARLELSKNSLTLSDLLFFEPSPAFGTNLYEAARTAYGSVLYRSRKVGIYWELYGQMSADSEVPVSLTLTPLPGNLLKRAINALGIGYRASPMNIRWRENSGAGFLSARSIMLDMSLIPPGGYEVSLEVGNDPKARTTRIVEVR